MPIIICLVATSSFPANSNNVQCTSIPGLQIVNTLQHSIFYHPINSSLHITSLVEESRRPRIVLRTSVIGISTKLRLAVPNINSTNEHHIDANNNNTLPFPFVSDFLCRLRPFTSALASVLSCTIHHIYNQHVQHQRPQQHQQQKHTELKGNT